MTEALLLGCVSQPKATFRCSKRSFQGIDIVGSIGPVS